MNLNYFRTEIIYKISAIEIISIKILMINNTMINKYKIAGYANKKYKYRASQFVFVKEL